MAAVLCCAVSRRAVACRAGVLSTEAGYCNGAVPEPTYEQVCSGNTGHAEVVQVTYDPREVSGARGRGKGGAAAWRRRGVGPRPEGGAACREAQLFCAAAMVAWGFGRTVTSGDDCRAVAEVGHCLGRLLYLQ